MRFYFNPRTRMGCDPRSRILWFPVTSISIHAPAWGATINRGGEALNIEISIHAPAWGAT